MIAVNLFNDMKLSGKTILVTRAAHQAGEFIRLIEQHGGTVITFPTIEITQPTSWNDCDQAIDKLYMYDGIIFTSRNGVEFFSQRLHEQQVSAGELSPKIILVVGEKTKQAVERHGLRVTLIPEKFTSFDLAKQLDHMDLHGKTFLFPRGNLGKDILQDNLKLLGANVDSITVYQTKKASQSNVQHLHTLLLDGKIDILTFTSPSTFNNFAALFSVDELKQISQKSTIAVIGPVTEKTITDAGLRVDITARESTIESFIKAIVQYFSGIKENRPEVIR